MQFPLRILIPLLTAIGIGACTGQLGDTLGGSNGNKAQGAADEIFPPALLDPYKGESLVTYDNTFITYDQLRGKTKIIFNDSWVRDGVDEFEAHIATFGGADFTTRYVEARSATSDFLLGLDTLSKDVCLTAAKAGTGPFTGLNLTTPLADTAPQTTTTYSGVNKTQTSISTLPNGCGINGNEVNFCTNGTMTVINSPFVSTDRYRVTTKARATGAGVQMIINVGGTAVKTFSGIAGTATDYSVDLDVKQGDQLSVQFANDGTDGNGVDMNLIVTSTTVFGPLSASTGTTRQDAASANIEQLYHKILYRKATDAEVADAYKLVKDVNGITGDQKSAWAGVCEALMHVPDFVFTLPPSRNTASADDKDVLLLVKLAADLVNRGPTDAEVNGIRSGSVSIDQQIDAYLASPDFRDTMLHRMRLRTQSDGSELGDQAARLWTYLFTTGLSYEDLLTGEYDVDASFQPQARPAYHGKTGVLTMKGYLVGKQGLPHYNYAARVLTDFMGYVFEVPPEVVQMRLGSTPSGTVDPNSLCFQCHNLLTPLSYQRRRWTDDGAYVEADADGLAIDQTDDELVANYPYKGDGLEAFAIKAVKKEKFIRHTIDAEFDMLLKRLMRADDDERVIYKQLFDALTTTGDLRASLKIILASPQYRGEQS